MSNNPINVKLLRRIKKHILEEPKRFDMERIRTPLDLISKRFRPECGTVCCIGGWGIKLSYPKAIPDPSGEFWQLKCGLEELAAGAAARLIGGMDVYRLFYEYKWPTTLYDQYERAKTPLQKAKAGAAAIDSYIEAKGDWGARGQ